MAMRHVAAVAFALGLLAGAAAGELCTKCKAGFYTTDVGKCVVCGGHTSSGAFKLCSKCSTKLRQCEHCRAKLPAGPKPKPATRPTKIDLANPGTYYSGRWTFVVSSMEWPPMFGQMVGMLYYYGKPLPRPPRLGDYYVTPWGRMVQGGGPRTRTRSPYGWFPSVTLRRAKALTPPAATAPTAKDMAAFMAALPVPKVDPTKEGSYTYTRGRWTYELSVKPRLRWGHLFYNRVAQRPVRANRGIGNFFDTPWGRMYYHGEYRHPWGVQGWQLVPPRNGPRRPARLRLREWEHVRKRFLTGLETLYLHLRYHGPQDKPYYSLTLRVPVVWDQRPLFWPAVQIKKGQAHKIVEHLGKEGFLVIAENVTGQKARTPLAPTYALTLVGTGGMTLYENLGWDLEMLSRLDALRKVLDGDTTKAMDKLLARMAGHRKQWTKEAATKPATRPAARAQ